MKLGRIKNLALGLWAATCMGSATAATFEDIQFWAGSGTNRAGLVIEWNDGKTPHSLMWGYRWNGPATGWDMLQTVVLADPRLFAHWGQFGWGPAIFGIGYDLNNSGGFGVNHSLVFDAGGLVTDTGATNAVDARVPIDSADHFLEGWNTGFWAYYLKNSTTNGWSSAMTGADGRTLTDGAWDGFSFAAGFVSSEPAEPMPAVANPFAVEVVAAQGPFGASPYDDPASLLGMPSTNFYDPWGGWSGGTTGRRVKLVEPAYNLDITQSHKLITTLDEGSSIVVRFEQPIQNDPAHPYGIDFLVFGNSFYTASGFVNDGADMNTLTLASGGFSEPMKVSVSPGYTGKAGQNSTNWQTWDWYRYEHGPYADTGFPTHAYRWNRTNSTWSSELMDFTKPVNPVFGSVLEAGGLSAADAIDLYDNSGGGTGFDLAESGFSAVQYVKIDGLTNHAWGEVDAISSVRPMFLGDSLSISPANLTNGTAGLRFQRLNHQADAALVMNFTSVSEVARVVTAPLSNAAELALYGRMLGGAAFVVSPILGSDAVAFQADIRIGLQPGYSGDGKDLVLLRQVETDWEDVSYSYEPVAGTALFMGTTNSSTFALLQVLPPRISITLGVDGFGNPLTTVRLPVVPGFTYTLERTEDFIHWDEVASISPLVLQSAALNYGDAAKGVFYRVRMNRR
jgi:hypothetical protein